MTCRQTLSSVQLAVGMICASLVIFAPTGLGWTGLGFTGSSSQARAAEPAAAARIQQFKRQFDPQFRQILETELLFIQTACGLTREESLRIAHTAEEVHERIVAVYAEAQFRRQRFTRGVLESEPRLLLSRALFKEVEALLPEDKAAAYSHELAEREVARRHVAVVSLLTKLDQQLVLTIQQREQFQQILEEEWQDSWCNQRFLTQGNRHFPSLPESRLLPLLTATQKDAWRANYKPGRALAGLQFGMLPEVQIEWTNGEENDALDD